MASIAKVIDGKKFMWDRGDYSAKEEAGERAAQYEQDGFETRTMEEDAKFLVYTRRVVTEIVLEGEAVI